MLFHGQITTCLELILLFMCVVVDVRVVVILLFCYFVSGFVWMSELVSLMSLQFLHYGIENVVL